MKRNALISDLDLRARARATRMRRWWRWPLRHLIVKGMLLRFRSTSRTSSVRAETFWEDTLRVELPEPLSSDIYRYGFYEFGLTRALLMLLGPGDVFFDVGAHFGYFSKLAIHLVGEGGSVHAFEPAPETAARLEENLSSAGNATVHRSAVWSRSEEIEMSAFDIRYSLYSSIFDPRLPDSKTPESIGGSTIEVRAVALDDLVPRHLPPPSFVKIDAESAELDVLHGMSELLREVRPILSLEVGDVGVEGVCPSREVLEYARSQGYDVYQCDAHGIHSHRIQDRYGYDNLLLFPRGEGPDRERHRPATMGAASP